MIDRDSVENETRAEKELGIFVAANLAWHQRGCVKRYGAVGDELCNCEKLAQESQQGKLLI